MTAQQEEVEAARTYTAFCVREDGAKSFFQMDRSESILEVAKFLRRYLREDQRQGTAALRTSAFARMEPVTDEQYMSRFLEKLKGKEVTSTGHLSVRDISFAEEISEINGLLNFYVETSFDADTVFGTHVCTGENDNALNIYANYDMAAGQVCDTLEVDLHWADGREEAVEYRLNAVEKAALLRKMDAYCQKQTGQTLAEYSVQRMAEDMTPPIGPRM